jgi:hypothetical protein
MQSHTTVDEIVELARSLSPLEKLKLIERLAPDLEAALSSATPPTRGRRALRGLLRGCSVGNQEIEEARREMWGAFPREDI